MSSPSERPMRIACIGECMAELAPTGGAGIYRLDFAGDTFNTAWYLAQLQPGWRVDYVSRLGSDRLSERARAAMAAAGIGTAHVGQTEGRTIGLYLIDLDAGERTFSYWRGRSAARRLADDPAALDAALDGADLTYLSGITLAILEDDGFGALIEALARARAAGTRVAFDPNLRPRLWPDTETMCDRVMRAAALADLALPSFEDEAAHFGDTDPAATLARYRDAGCATVVVKDGPRPVAFADARETGTMPVEPAARVVDTTAAGDSFNAGLLASLLAGRPVAEAVARGARLAARVVSHRGALMPNAGED